MTIAEIEDKVQSILSNVNPATFIYDLLLAYGHPRASITRLQQGGLNLAKTSGEIIWKKKLYFSPCAAGESMAQLELLKKSEQVKKHEPRFILVTDYQTLAAFDYKTADTLEIPLLELGKHFDFFLPWAGMEKAQYQSENPADVKAAEKMARLYDEIKKHNSLNTPAEAHNLNVFLSRLLFCFFAEDTGIFQKSQFTQALSSHTQADGSDLHLYLDKLFEVLDTAPNKRGDLPAYLSAFPYVNGGLYKDPHHAPFFTRRSRQIVLDCGELDWSSINPDIFGSMIQAVVSPDHRGGLGMHYTSVPNIMKVIEPLFLNELKEEFAAAKGNVKKMNALLQRIWKIKIFDPACGSGNFLIIAYKELRNLEMKIYQELDALRGNLGSGRIGFVDNYFSNISLANFYGIELDDFAHEVAMLSLWLAEHQMNQAFLATFGRTKPPLPLRETGQIVHGNATRLDWDEVCPKLEGDEVYVLGNPPYLGARMQSNYQKMDLDYVFKGIEKYKDLDYIACWFYLGAKFIKASTHKAAFVSTNSICQGEQVALLWPLIFGISVDIQFAHTSFKWTNNAKDKAAVIVVVVGLQSSYVKSQKRIFSGIMSVQVDHISPYLIKGTNIFVERKSSPISNFPNMPKGNMPYDGGNLILSTEEKNSLIGENPNASKYIKRLMGSFEFINDAERWCLWIKNDDLEAVKQILSIRDRIEGVRQMRLLSKDLGANKLAERSHQFREVNETVYQSLIIPSVSSENREYIPIGFVGNDTIITNLAFAIYDPPVFLFSLLTSRMHMVWVRAVAGRLKSDYRYSSALCYNTFPFPPISDAQKQELEKHVYHILEEREKHSEKTLAQLYDPDKMPDGLREAHHLNDLAVERCYRSKPFSSDEERLEYLFKLYEQMIAAEQNKDTLFATTAAPKKRK